MFYVLTISLHLPIIHYNLVQVWLATLLSFVVVTVAYALLTRHSWSKDPSFAFVDSECSYNQQSLSILSFFPTCLRDAVKNVLADFFR